MIRRYDVDPDQAMIAKIVYFAHDLSDQAVHRRVRMLVAGGAAVTPIGFRRSAEAPKAVEGLHSIDLVRNYFVPRGFPSPIRLVENKVLMIGERETGGPFCKAAAGRIGWFGMIRYGLPYASRRRPSRRVFESGLPSGTQ